jgi:hypothetical protein
MKNILFILLISNIDYGQLGALPRPVKLIPQKGCSLCWAASLEMILNYHKTDNSINQISIAKNYQSNKTCIVRDCPDNNNCDFKCTPFENTCDIGFSQNSNFEDFLNTYSYHSKPIKGKVLSWNTIVNEIDNKRPLLVRISLSETNYHIVVISGYNNRNGFQFVEIKDPWRPCQGREYWLNYEYFQTQNPSMCFYVSEIYPKSLPQTNNILNNKNSSFRTIEFSDSTTIVKACFSSINLLPNFEALKFVNIKFINVKDKKTNFKLLAYFPYNNTLPQLVLEKVNGSWKVSSIENCEYFYCNNTGEKHSYSISLNYKKGDIKNKTDEDFPNLTIGDNGINYQIIRFVNTEFEFLQFNYSGKDYLISTKNDSVLDGDLFDKDEVYTYGDIEKEIKKKLK